jgi:hypothetical protein
MCSVRAIKKKNVFRTSHFFISNARQRIFTDNTGMNTVCIKLEKDRRALKDDLNLFYLYFDNYHHWPLVIVESEYTHVVLVHPFNYNTDAYITNVLFGITRIAFLM